MGNRISLRFKNIQQYLQGEPFEETSVVIYDHWGGEYMLPALQLFRDDVLIPTQKNKANVCEGPMERMEVSKVVAEFFAFYAKIRGIQSLWIEKEMENTDIGDNGNWTMILAPGDKQFHLIHTGEHFSKDDKWTSELYVEEFDSIEEAIKKMEN